MLALTAVLGLISVLTRPQPGYFGDITDEYFTLGAMLRVNGTLGLAANEPSALRAPGYPAFIAFVLAIALPDPARISATWFESRGELAVCVAQALVLAIAAAALYVWLASRLDRTLAFLAALVFGLGPQTLVLVGALHYGVLHMALMLVACAALQRALRTPEQAWPLVVSGLLWGISALVRPVTLLLPVFLLLSLSAVARWPWRRALRAAVLVSLAMAAALLPWTVRNWRINGRLVPVNDNNWATLWGQTERPLPRDPNRYLWFDLFIGEFLPVFSGATGVPAYDYVTHVRRIGDVEHAFRARALENLRDRPGVYARNAKGALVSMLTEPNPALLAAFREIGRREPRHPGVVALPQSWFVTSKLQPVLPRPLGLASNAVFYATMTLALIGAVAACLRQEALGAVLLAVLACVLLTHALVFTHLMHYYVRWPFAVGLSALALDVLASRGPRWRLAGRMVLGALAAVSVAVSLALL